MVEIIRIYPKNSVQHNHGNEDDNIEVTKYNRRIPFKIITKINAKIIT